MSAKRMPVAVDLSHSETDMDLLKDQDATQEADNPWRASLGTSTSAHIPENIPTLIEQAKSGNPSLYYLRPLIADNTRSMKLSKHGCSFECGERQTSRLVFCPKCPQNDNIYCQTDWAKERRHNGRDPSHRQIQMATYEHIESIFTNERDPEENYRLHEADVSSSWFGLNTDENEKPQLGRNDVYEQIVASSDFKNYQDQYPSLVSFIGTTGSGKSTLIVSNRILLEFYPHISC